MREVDERAAAAAKSGIGLDEFILEFEPFILRVAAKTMGKFISKTDDEWLVALEAFSQAVFSYSMEKGSFLSFATLVIRRRCIDYIRVQSKRLPEIPVDPSLFGSESNNEENHSAIKTELTEKISYDFENQSKEILYEIESLGPILSAYGFTLFELTTCSPKSKKTKKACAQAVLYIMNNTIVLEQMKETRMLPLKIIERKTDIPRKLMENHRKYIIAAVEILTGEYPYLSEYLRYIREEAIL